MKSGAGGLILAGLAVAVIGFLITTEIVDLIGKVLIIGGVILGVFGLFKVFSGGSED